MNVSVAKFKSVILCKCSVLFDIMYMNHVAIVTIHVVDRCVFSSQI